MNKRKFLQSVGLMALGTSPLVSGLSYAIDGQNALGYSNTNVQLTKPLMALSAFLLASDTLSIDVGRDILDEIEHAAQLPLLQQLLVHYHHFTTRVSTPRAPGNFFVYLQQQKQIRLLQLGKDIVYAWYTGISRFDSNEQKRLTYAKSLQYSINKDIYTPSSYCGGEHGYWQYKPVGHS